MALWLPALGPEPDAPFPPAEQACRRPNGLLAMGGDLSPGRLLHAYRNGVFPWYSEGQPILWWTPDPRMVLRPDSLHVSRRLRRELRQSRWRISVNQLFDAVIDACASEPRDGQDGTWITPAMRDAYVALHRHGHAHSVEVREGEQLVGGIYGVGIGRMFFGESMFSRRSGGSKFALVALCRALHACGVEWLDGQVESDHLATMGFGPVRRSIFLQHCRQACDPAIALPLAAVDRAVLQPPALAAWPP